MEFLGGMLLGGFLGSVGIILLFGGAKLRGERPEESVADFNDNFGEPVTIEQAVRRDVCDRIARPMHTVHFIRNKFALAYVEMDREGFTKAQRKVVLDLAAQFGAPPTDETNCGLSGCEECENV